MVNAQRDVGAFVSEQAYRRAVLGDRVETMTFQDDFAVTLEISAAAVFPMDHRRSEAGLAQR